jgi:uncharacterized membrane protein
MISFFRRHSPRFFLNEQETKKLEDRVALFEKRTSCELVFHFRRRLTDDPMARAKELFYEFGLEKTTHRNGILIIIALTDRKFAIWADEGVIRHTGDKLWDGVRDHMSHLLKHGQRLDALIHAIVEAETVLEKEQPRFKGEISRENKNELSNAPIIEEKD